MRHINESIIGKRGSASNLKMILKHPKDDDVLIVYPALNRGVDAIDTAIDEDHPRGIEGITLGGGDSVFVGTFKDFEKLHTREKVDCDIYVFNVPTKVTDAVDWLSDNIDEQSDFFGHFDVVSDVFSGEIKF